MAFKYVSSLAADSGRIFNKEFLIVNSATVKVGDFVILASGFLQRVALGNAILGLCEGFVANDGTVLERADASAYSGTFTANTQTYAAASDNQTVDKVRAVVLIDPLGIYSGPVDVALGTTTGSDLPGYYSDVVAASGTVDESSAVTGSAQLFHLGKNPDDSTQMLYMINEGALNL